MLSDKAVQSPLHTPVSLGALDLPNRIIMSPMTRLRADADLAPPEIVADYYAQRAGAGLVITETIAVAPYGAGYPAIPGIFTESQQQGWKNVVRAVHRAGGRIAAQLWHVGHARGEEEANGRGFGWAVADEIRPHEMAAGDFSEMVAGFTAGARAARDAGFDSVEIHNGNGFLLDRFLRSATNSRTDDYGGTLANRTRLVREIIEAVSGVYGTDRVGIRISPSAMVNGGPDPEAEEVFDYFLKMLSGLGLAYVHATRTTSEDRAHGSGDGIPLAWVRGHYQGNLLGAGEFNQADGERAVTDGVLDGVVYGRLFLANPDLPVRFARLAQLNAPNPDTFYTPGPIGLIDYPLLG